MKAKILKSIKRAYSVGPYETLHVESAIEKEIDCATEEELATERQKLADLVVEDFKSYKDQVFKDLENCSEMNHSSDIVDCRDKNEDEEKEKQSNFAASLLEE